MDQNVSLLTVSNITNSVDEYIPYVHRPETYILPFVFAVIFIVGVVGNGTLMFIFLRNRSMRNIPNTYIMNLAVGDFLVMIGTVPFISTIYTFESWPYGEFVCKASEFLRDVSVGVTVLTLTMLSVDRYMAIVRPMQKLKHAKSFVVVCAGIIWIVSLIIASPGAYFSYLWEIEVDDNKKILVCYPFPQAMRPWYPQTIVLMKFTLLYAVPLCTIGSFYILMSKHLLMASRNTIGLNDTHWKQLKARSKIAKVVLVFVIMFAVCFFPSHLFLIWFNFHPNSMENYNHVWHVLKIVGYVLTFGNSCLNPIALYGVSGVYRNYFKRYLFCSFGERPGLLRRRFMTIRGHSRSSSRMTNMSTKI